MNQLMLHGQTSAEKALADYTSTAEKVGIDKPIPYKQFGNRCSTATLRV